LLWLEITIQTTQNGISVSARGSRDEKAEPHALLVTPAELAAFGAAVGQAALARRKLDGKPLEFARELYRQVLQGGEVRDAYTTCLADAKGEPVLLRFALADGALQAVPWEAMIGPPDNVPLASSASVRVVRTVSKGKPFVKTDVAGAVRVLCVAAAAGRATLDAIKTELEERIKKGEIVYLDPLVGPRASYDNFLKSLRGLKDQQQSPHVVHFVGHGALRGGTPVVVLPGADGDPPLELDANLLATALKEYAESLRLVVLDACEGASPGEAGSAAEILARSTTAGVIAHLWNVQSQSALACTRELYGALARSGQQSGDVAASLHSARLLLQGTAADAFSPVLYLRGTDPVLFDFARRRVTPPVPPAAPALIIGKALDPALARLLGGPFSLVLGDGGEDQHNGRAALRAALQLNQKTQAALPLDLANQCYEIIEGRAALDSLFLTVASGILQKTPHPSTPLAEAIAGFLRAGVHVTLLWLPVLENALATRHPGENIYVVEPLGGRTKPRVQLRPAHKQDWEPLGDNAVDFGKDFVVLRPYGGYLPTLPPVRTRLTQDDFLQAPDSAELLDEIMFKLQRRPAFVCGCSVLAWQHRMVLKWLFPRKLLTGSVAIIAPDAEPIEQTIWEEKGGGLPDAVHVDVVRRTTDELAALLTPVDT
jgi:hypothetical protein